MLFCPEGRSGLPTSERDIVYSLCASLSIHPIVVYSLHTIPLSRAITQFRRLMDHWGANDKLTYRLWQPVYVNIQRYNINRRQLMLLCGIVNVNKTHIAVCVIYVLLGMRTNEREGWNCAMHYYPPQHQYMFKRVVYALVKGPLSLYALWHIRPKRLYTLVCLLYAAEQKDRGTDVE